MENGDWMRMDWSSARSYLAVEYHLWSKCRHFASLLALECFVLVWRCVVLSLASVLCTTEWSRR